VARGLSIETRRIPINGGYILEVLLKGEFYYTNYGDVEKAVTEEMKEGLKGILIDVEGVEYVDSTGLAKLVSLSIRASKRKAGVVLFNVSPRIKRLLQSIHLQDLLEIRKTRDEALDYLKSQSTEGQAGIS